MAYNSKRVLACGAAGLAVSALLTLGIYRGLASRYNRVPPRYSTSTQTQSNKNKILRELSDGRLYACDYDTKGNCAPIEAMEPDVYKLICCTSRPSTSKAKRPAAQKPKSKPRQTQPATAPAPVETPEPLAAPPAAQPAPQPVPSQTLRYPVEVREQPPEKPPMLTREQLRRGNYQLERCPQ